ncbi:ADP-ribosylglycohydrolase family protein [Paenarthrobacter aurescens]|uniref:Putative ADP-ribosylglycohydrolase n=1 Tax=Paenarthrobacter aurescens TaxID=43663 RepID=A0A4Y3N9X8_PAEAU|nr:ADP-ribosylglycohydrolase family protein [Paenarthrobacter aurescens]MDO6143985.1 ADP-ribosylglycohydrolase family protein [Paenarthrobacter aurescens]MDO6147832.1 ADP-ribosylglycohydrolase family protein [Paenarthrobacter aurescens]MDO6159076.1 ADP-ribosylglycohydrolase family protein [Paenarthrobacter aurescens]MDO6163060.1 ADP-ribosylglycohydrolase family protein [Paenarthrobacter aurescens]GEB18462.1 putative ADP-ribosylglycohydrolase [Paenarthrobacter aurescens]
MSVEPKTPAVPSFESRVYGTLLGGALGDSLGYAVEFESIDAIRARYGSAGLLSFGQLDGGSHFSDDTQMTLYTVDGLVEALEWANDGVAADEIACLWLAYLRWLGTQDVAAASSAPVPQPRWIDAQEVLHHRRAPGNACLSGLATGQMGTVARPVNADSKGCGTVMRSAPFGLIPHISREAVYKLSSDASSLTHGHPSARLSAAAFSLLIHNIVAGSDIRTAAAEALDYVNGVPTKAPELPERLEAALQFSLQPTTLDPEKLTEALGEGWVAEEALAVGLYAVLATSGGTPAEHFRNAITLAINHSGDSDSTGSIAGNILGAYYGEDCLPADWLEALEAPEIIRGMAERLLAVTTG